MLDVPYLCLPVAVESMVTEDVILSDPYCLDSPVLAF